MPKPRALIRWTWLNAVPMLLILMGLCLLTLGARQVADSTGGPPKTGSPQDVNPKPGGQKPEERIAAMERQVNDLAAKREALKDQLAVLGQQASQNQWLLSIVLAA